MKNFLHKIISHWPTLTIILVWVIIAVANYRAGTYLTGWDSLQTELNSGLAIKRAWWSVWQEYQSLGLLAGMAHSADLVRAVFMWGIGFLLPQSIERYAFHIATILIGSLGMLKLLSFNGFSKTKKGFGFIGALAYLLNFNVIQIMALPFEPFSVFIAALPWLIWVYIKTITQPKISIKDWLFFTALFIVATPLAVLQQLFAVLCITLALITVGIFVQNRTLTLVKRTLIAGFLVIVVNAFWILPQAYFLTENGEVVKTAKINQLATDDVFYRNKDKGTIPNFLSQTSFLYESQGTQQEPLFASWQNYRENILVQITIFSTSAVMLFGLFVRTKYQIPFLLLFAVSAIALLSNTPVFEQINELTRSQNLVNQIFRSPFTKFGTLAALVSSFFTASGVYGITKLFSLNYSQLTNQILSSKLVRTITKSRFHISTKIYVHEGSLSFKKYAHIIRYSAIGIAACLILIAAFPAFSGKYISDDMKVAIPENYIQAIDYFKTVDKNKRIALLPEYTHWGWYYHNWGYNGSGFLWYGIEQPIISRTFDVWNTDSESYYWEAKNALERENMSEFEDVLKKYDVDYVLLDYSLDPVVVSMKAIQYDRIDAMLSQTSRLTLEKKWGNLTLYRVNHEKKIDDFVSVAAHLPNVGPEYPVTNSDTAYFTVGDYVTNKDRAFDYYFPFLDITTQTDRTDVEWKIGEDDSSWYFLRPIPEGVKYLNFSETSGEYDATVYQNNQTYSFTFPYQIQVSNTTLSITFPKIQIENFDVLNADVSDCFTARGSFENKTYRDTLVVESFEGNSACFTFDAPNLEQKQGYLARIESHNIAGRDLFFYVLDKTKEQPYVETRLNDDVEYFVMGDRYDQGIGYSFSFQNDSFDTIDTINQLDSVAVYLIPYDLIKNLYAFEKTASPAQFAADFDATKQSYYKYVVDVNSTTPMTIILNQAYSDGWHAYVLQKNASAIQRAFPALFGKEITTHVLVNNWANGWELDNTNPDETISIVYLPQYLQYAGITVLGITMLVLTISVAIASRKDQTN